MVLLGNIGGWRPLFLALILSLPEAYTIERKQLGKNRISSTSQVARVTLDHVYLKESHPGYYQ